MNTLYINRIERIERLQGISEQASYYLALPAMRALDKGLALHSPVTILAGENGTGKSTLLEAIAVNYGFNPEGGTRNFNFTSVQTHSGLYRDIRLIKGIKRPLDGFFLRAESFYNVATELDRLDEAYPDDLKLNRYYGGKSLHHQSHGESFLALMLNRFSGQGLYLLDEPEAALSPSRQLTLLAQMHHLLEQGSQFIIATHSSILMGYPGAEIFWLDEEGIRPVDYKETEHYILTRKFLNDPQSLLRYLWDEKG